MTNQDFCYWLQGYFEISKIITLNKQKILVIQRKLTGIDESLQEFTQWLSDVLSFIINEDCRQELADYFLPLIRHRLNMIFYHVIDQSYDTEVNLDTSKKIHDGIIIP